MLINYIRSSTNKLLLLAALLPLLGCQDEQQKAAEYFESAKDYYESQDYDLATVELKNAIKNDSSLAEAYLLQAKIYQHKGEIESMSAFLASALQQQPNHVEANIEAAKLLAKASNIPLAQKHLDTAIAAGASDYDHQLTQGLIYLQSDDLQAAEQALQSALSTTPNSTEARIGLTLVALKKGDYSQALTIIDKAKDNDPKNENILLLKTRIHTLENNYSAAITQAHELTLLFPSNPSNFYLEAALQDTTGDSAGAEQTLRRAISANPDNIKTKISLANYLGTKDKTQRAIELINAFIATDDNKQNTDLKLLLAELYQQEQDYNQATHIYSALANEQNKNALTAKNKLALIALKNNDKTGALNILNEILATEFNNIEALISRGLIYLSDDQTEKAITDLMTALREQPDSTLALLFIARAYSQANNDSQAIQHLDELLSIAPYNKEAIELYSQLLHRNDQYKKSIKPLERYHSKNNASISTNKLLLTAYLNTKSWEQAKVLASQIAKNINQPDFTLLNQALIFRKTNRNLESISVYKSLIDKNVFISTALQGITDNYNDVGKPQSAINYLTSYLAENPDDFFSVSLLAAQYTAENSNNSIEAAEQLLTKALEQHPQWGEGHLLLAKIYARQEQWSKAIASGLNANKTPALNQALELQLLLASSYEQLENHTQAIKHYRSALEISPSFDAAANNLALLLSADTTNSEHLKEALELADRFKNSRNPFYLDTLGWIYHLQDKNQKAAALLEKAIFSVPESAIIHYHLGVTHHKLQEFQDAKFHLTSALALGKEDSFISFQQHAEKLLNSIPETAEYDNQ